MINRKAKFLLMMTAGLIVMGFSSAAFAQDSNAMLEAARISNGGWIVIYALIIAFLLQGKIG